MCYRCKNSKIWCNLCLSRIRKTCFRRYTKQLVSLSALVVKKILWIWRNLLVLSLVLLRKRTKNRIRVNRILGPEYQSLVLLLRNLPVEDIQFLKCMRKEIKNVKVMAGGVWIDSLWALVSVKLLMKRMSRMLRSVWLSFLVLNLLIIFNKWRRNLSIEI